MAYAMHMLPRLARTDESSARRNRVRIAATPKSCPRSATVRGASTALSIKSKRATQGGSGPGAGWSLAILALLDACEEG